MSQYKSQLPDIKVDQAVADFFQIFYQISDTPDAHEQYSEQFTKDATLIMASKKVEGTESILALRKAMWEKVASRSHKPIKIFPFGENSHEVMLYGIVEYGLKAGGSNSVDWAARGHLTDREGTLKMDFYQVYLDTAAQTAKK